MTLHPIPLWVLYRERLRYALRKIILYMIASTFIIAALHHPAWDQLEANPLPFIAVWLLFGIPIGFVLWSLLAVLRFVFRR